jgi:hypothetical protein
MRASTVYLSVSLIIFEEKETRNEGRIDKANNKRRNIIQIEISKCHKGITKERRIDKQCQTHYLIDAHHGK